MEHKKSINAKDIFYNEQKFHDQAFPSNENQSQIMQPNQPHFINIQYCPNHQGKYKEKTSIQHSFLLSIRASRGKNRYKMKHSLDQMHESSNSVDLVNHLESNDPSPSKDGKSWNMATKRANENYSPFDNDKFETRRGQIVLHSVTAFQNPEINNKINLKIKRQKTQNLSYYKKSKSVKQENKLSRISAKLVEFKTDFSKTRIFESKNNPVLEMSEKKLNPYQLSIRRKNIKLMKVKLNSLGEKADEIQRQKFDEMSRLCQINKLNMIKQIKRYRYNNPRQKKQKNNYQTTDRNTIQNNNYRNLNILSKTIQISEIPSTARKDKRNKSNESHSGREKSQTRQTRARIIIED